jgi:endonuclease/exonuclease/phosphatase (EEP) superfamily protein YafD
LAADFNITPWSPVFADILEGSGLRDSSLGFGVAPTWLSRPLFFGLPIDHILVSPDIKVKNRHVGPDVGSDHFPVIADLAF